MQPTHSELELTVETKNNLHSTEATFGPRKHENHIISQP